jgi:protein involved in polysaccharide export with SLBB domain
MNSVRNIIVLWRGALALAAGLFLLAGCVTPPESSSTDSKFGPGPDIITVGERLEIEFLDINPPQKIDQMVQQDGTISLIHGQQAKVAGKSVAEAQADIRALYVPKYFFNVTINIKRDVRYYSVGGYVKSPGRQPYTAETTVVTAIQSAGDLTVYGDPKRVQVIRSNGKIQTVNLKNALKDPKKDLPIYPGDRIHVPLAKW